MEPRFDEFAKALAESTTRREALRRLGGLLLGTMLASMGLDRFAWGQSASCQQLCQGLAGRPLRNCLKGCRRCEDRGRPACRSGPRDSLRCCAAMGGCCAGLVCCSPREQCCTATSPGGQVSGTCCAAGEACCATTAGTAYCADTLTDPDNCGTCGLPCPGVCCGGDCCLVGETCCPGPGGGSCVDLRTRYEQCGRCGHACANHQICRNGRCVTVICGPGERLCRAPRSSNYSCCQPNQACCNGQCCAPNQVCEGDSCVACPPGTRFRRNAVLGGGTCEPVCDPPCTNGTLCCPDGVCHPASMGFPAAICCQLANGGWVACGADYQCWAAGGCCPNTCSVCPDGSCLCGAPCP